MPIDPLYSDSTSTFLAGQNQANVPEPTAPGPNTSITSIAKAVGRGIGQGGASLFGAAADTASGLSQSLTDPDAAFLNPAQQAADDQKVNAAIAKGKAGTLFQSSAGTAAYDFADTLKPDPTNSTKIDQIVQGAVSGLTQIVPAAVLGGPLAGAAVGGASIGLGGAEDLKRQGVDVGTRTAVGTLEGVAGGLGAVLPAGGSTLAKTAALVAVGGPGFTIAQSAAEKAILKNAKYDHLADQIDPLDPVNIAASTLIAGTFGAAHAVGAARAAGKADAAPTPSAPVADTGTPITAMPVDARKALPYNSPALDAYATQAAQAASVPPEMLLFIKNKGERSNSNQVSPTGAKGVMQFEPGTYKAFGKGDPQDPVNSIDAAAAYSADLLKRYDGDVRAALTEYNGGVKQAQAVHAGGKPTDPETIAYLKRYDEYAANHQITNAKFDPTPEQTDAALTAHSQRIVDDAYVFGSKDDPAEMNVHQQAFELAARQMDAGLPPDVSSLIPESEFDRAHALRGLVENAEAHRADLNATAANVREPGEVASLRGELSDLQSSVPDTSSQAVKEAARGYQDQGMKFKAALAQAQKDSDATLSAHQDRISRLQGILDQHREGVQAAESVKVLDSHLEDMRTALAETTAPATRKTGVAKALAGIDRSRVRTEARGEPVMSDVPFIPKAEPVTESRVSGEAAPQSASAKPEGAASAVEQNVRQAALEQPDTVAHLDANAGPKEGKISDLLKTIDDEHANTLQDASLLQVAANCFISAGD